MTERYDFYKKPPNTKLELREWLTSWLKPETTPETGHLFEVDDQTYVIEYGFRRAFSSHTVLRNITTNEYVWWVFENYDINTFPTTRYLNYDHLLESVIDDYYRAWKLPLNNF
jgi:hypothetical protein